MIKIAALALVCAAALPASAAAQGTVQDSVHKAMTAKKERREERREKAGKAETHPEIRAAIASLQRSKEDLEKASHDYGGHRVEAIKSIDEALKHLHLALDYDKK
jgi:hypothetical protein